MERFFETGGNAMEEMVFNSATGKLEIVSKENSARPGRHVVLDMNKPGGGGFFVTQSSPLLLNARDKAESFMHQKFQVDEHLKQICNTCP